MMDMITILGGDARFFWPENMPFLIHLPYAWDSSLNTGIGISQVNTLWITSYLNLTASFSFLGLSWPMIQLLFWLLPALVISFLSSFFLYRKCITTNNLYAVLAGIIYTTNTYFLSIFFGGQVGVSFGYAFIPLVFLSFITLVKQKKIYVSVLTGFVLALQVLFDPRITALTVVSLLFFYFFSSNFLKKDLLYLAIIPFAIIFLLHAYWFLPLLLYKSTIIPQGFDSLSGVTFLSFALLENSLSLLHPNWPENIFGKVTFMKPEFLSIPLLAYSSLLFIKKSESKNQKVILFFALLGLISIFFAKGTNEPFGGSFLWLITTIPGFSMFRDSTKFYALIALSYSILIPYSVSSIAALWKKRFPKYGFAIIFLLFWLFSLRLFVTTPAMTRPIHHVPESYVQLKNFLVSQKQFSRTLWIPAWQRYGFFSDVHPAIGRGELFKEASASGMIRELKKAKTLALLQDLGVAYLVVPEDSEGELFLSDRKYDDKTYQKTISDIEKIPNITKVKTFGKIIVFAAPNPRDRFWSPSKTLKIQYTFLNPTEYKVTIQNAKKGDVLVFSESFAKHWIAKNEKFNIKSTQFENKVNSFILPTNGNYTVEVFYQPQMMVNFGLLISCITFTGIIFYLIRFKKS